MHRRTRFQITGAKNFYFPFPKKKWFGDAKNCMPFSNSFIHDLWVSYEINLSAFCQTMY